MYWVASNNNDVDQDILKLCFSMIKIKYIFPILAFVLIGFMVQDCKAQAYDAYGIRGKLPHFTLYLYYCGL